MNATPLDELEQATLHARLARVRHRIVYKMRSVALAARKSIPIRV